MLPEKKNNNRHRHRHLRLSMVGTRTSPCRLSTAWMGPEPEFYPPRRPSIYPSPPPPPVVDFHARFPPGVHNHTHHVFDKLTNRPTVRVYCKSDRSYSLAVRDGKVILARSDPYDTFQHWIKDEKFSMRVKDEEGFPSFALVNKATGLAMKHSIGATHPVQLIPYNPNFLDESILWTESRDTGDGYRAIRMINNIRLNVNVFHGGVHDGSTIVLWEWKKGVNQRWKIVPYCKSLPCNRYMDNLHRS